MILYKDRITGLDFLSDAHKMEDTGAFYKVYGKMIKEDNAISESVIGGNKSAEDSGGPEETQSEVKWCIDIVSANRLENTEYNRDDFKSEWKTYIARLIKKIPREKKDAFEEDVRLFTNQVLSSFSEFQFFRPTEDVFEREGMMAFKKMEGETPVMFFLKEGLVGEVA